MKKILLPLAALIVLIGVSITGCSGVGYVIGTGQMVDKAYDYQDFTSVEISHAFQYDIQQSNTYGITVTTHENVIPYLDVYKSGKTLIVRLKPGSFTNTDLKAAIKMPELEGLSVSGASKGIAAGFKSSHNFTLKTSGASQLDMDLETGPAQIDVSGASKVTGTLQAQDTRLTVSGASRCELTGSSGNTNIDISGASRLDSPNFRMKDADISVSGASHATINTAGTLSLDVSGASTLSYLGNPTMNKVNVTGASRINSQ